MARPVRNPNEPPVRDQILDAASALFGDFGYESTSMKAIAEKASITPAGMYYHFHNKQDLLYHCLEKAIVGLERECRMVTQDCADPTAALQAFVQTHITYQLDRISDVAIVYTRWVYASRNKASHLTDQQRECLRELETQHFKRLRGILVAGKEDGVFHITDITMTAFAIIGMCEHVLTWAKKSGKHSSQEIAEEYAGYALRLAGAG